MHQDINFKTMNSYIKSTLLLVCLLFSIHASAQKKYIKKADQFYKQKRFYEAIEYYTQSLEKLKQAKKNYVIKQLAFSYKNLFDYKNTAIWYEKYTALADVPDKAFFEYGHVLIALGKNQKALEQFNIYCQRTGNSELFPKLKAIALWAESEAAKESKPYKVYKTNLESGDQALGLAFYKEGLMFSKPEKEGINGGTVYYDLAYSPIRDSINFDPAQSILNRSFFDGTPSLTADGKTLYFTSNSITGENYDSKKSNSSVLPNGENFLNIFYAIHERGSWSTPVLLEIDQQAHNFVFPFVSEDGNTLFFASDMPGGQGKMDIYRINRTEQNKWSKPENLGTVVNSEGDDIYPFLVNDKFYFSSREREGFGGLDIYFCEIKDNVFVTPKNMGKPINSTADDFAFIINKDQKSGYLASNRGTDSSKDIVYKFEHKTIPFIINGVVSDEAKFSPIVGALVKLFLFEEANKIFIDGWITEEDGKWEFIIESGKKWAVEFEKKGYISQNIMINQDPNNLTDWAVSNYNVTLNYDQSFIAQNVKEELIIEKTSNVKQEIMVENPVKIEKNEKIDLPKKEKIEKVENKGKTEQVENIKKTPVAEKTISNGISSNKTTYVVQIGAYKNPSKFKYSNMGSLGKVNKHVKDGITKFTIGSFADHKSADEFRKKVINAGVKDAFVVSLKEEN